MVDARPPAAATPDPGDADLRARLAAAEGPPRAEERLADAERVLADTQRTAHVGSWAWTQPDRLEWSPEMYRIFGIDEDGFTGSLADVIARAVHPDDREAVERSNRTVIEEGRAVPLQYRVLRPDGTVRTVWAEAGRLTFDDEGRPLTLTGVVIDITERAAAEQALRESELRWKFAVDGTRDGLWDWDVPRGSVWYSPRWKAMLGYEDHEIGDDLAEWSSRVHPDDLERTLHDVRAHLDGETPFYANEHRMRRKDGTWVWVLDRGMVLTRDQDDAPVRMIGTHADISAPSIRGGPARGRGPLPEPRGGGARDRLHLLAGCGGNLLLGARDRDPGLPARGLHRRGQSLGLADPPGGPRRRRGRRRGGDGPAALLGVLPDARRRRRLALDGGPVHRVPPDGRPPLRRGVRPRRHGPPHRRGRARAPDRAAPESRRLEAIGRLAGGVAHDFNNMLGAILGHTELALDALDPADPVHADLEEVRSAARRSADLTRQLLAFARKQVAAPRVVDVNAHVASLLAMLRRLIGEDVDLRWLPGADLPPILIDTSQLDQVLANLSVNARDAIDGVGRIEIATEVVDAGAGLGANGLPEPGRYVALRVTDDGCGMDGETVARIYEPFFTTKDIGRGTGLGLATVHGIVVQNNGRIDVESVVGSGTTFRVLFPACASPQPRPEPEAAAAASEGGTETVLLVEDEPVILGLAARMLRRQGYRVLAAPSPADALRLAELHDGPIDLLVTDVVMPGSNGRDLAEAVARLRPGIRELFMSGYTADVIANHGVLDGGTAFLQKPFTPRQLASAVREVLDRGPAPGR